MYCAGRRKDMKYRQLLKRSRRRFLNVESLEKREVLAAVSLGPISDGFVATEDALLVSTATQPYVSAAVSGECQVADSYELVNLDGNPISNLARVFIGGDGVATAEIDLDARKIPTNHVFYVDESAGPGGDGLSWASAFQDIHQAFGAVGAMPINSATLQVASGNYTWGDIENPGFSFNVIGAGSGNTMVGHTAGDRYAAEVRGRDVYIEGITFLGGETALDIRNASQVTVVGSELSGATEQDGLNIANAETVVIYETISHHNHADGFSYTNPSGARMEVFEAFVVGSDNGQNSLWNSQGSSIHATVEMVRVGGLFERNPTNISDVSSGVGWNIDVTTRDALANDQGDQYLNYNVSGGGIGWIVGGSHGEGRNHPSVVNAVRDAEIHYVSKFGTLDPETHIVTGNSVVDDRPLRKLPSPCSAPVAITEINPDTGNPDDFITSDQQITVAGTFGGGQLDITINGLTFDNDSPELQLGEFNWILDLTGVVLPEGTHSITADSTNPAEIFSTASQLITIDSTAPVTPTIDSIDEDTDGAGDFVTKDPTLLISGTWPATAAQLRVTVDATVYELGADSQLASSGSGTWTLDLTANALAAGSHTVLVEVQDIAGNIASSEQSVVVDVVEVVDLGPVGKGIAGDDAATGTGYIMHSRESLFVRFAANPPMDGNSDQMIPVRYADGSWQYCNNAGWHAFTPVAGDRLIASVNFGAFTMASLQGTSGQVFGIEQGFESGDLTFQANVWSGKTNKGEFTIDGTFYTIAKPGSGGTWFSLGDLNSGVAVSDGATGTGYLMYSAASVHTRFSGNPPNSNNSDHLIAVLWNGTEWRYNNNSHWFGFTPASGDRLLASVDFDTDMIVSLQGSSGQVFGVEQGFEDGDLSFHPDTWAQQSNEGEIFVDGTFFTAPLVENSRSFLLEDLRSGVAVHDQAVGTGYLMYSSTSVHSRFLDNAPNSQNSDQVIAVRYESGRWEYNNNSRWFGFTPASGDRLLASVDFDADTIVSLQGSSGQVFGVEQGFEDGDLSFHPDTWAQQSNEGEIFVDGTFFTAPPVENSQSFLLEDLRSGVAIHDQAVGTGYLMYSSTSVHSRFLGNPPNSNNSDHLIAVRYENGQWEYNNNSRWFGFTPASDDRLLASVDFSEDTVASLAGSNGSIFGMKLGFTDGDLQFEANRWGDSSNFGEFTVTGTYFAVGTGASNEPPQAAALSSQPPEGTGTSDEASAYDVNADQQITALDALMVLNYLNRQPLAGEGAAPSVILDENAASGSENYDVSGDGRTTALDALLVINALNRGEQVRSTETTGSMAIRSESSGQPLGSGAGDVASLEAFEVDEPVSMTERLSSSTGAEDPGTASARRSSIGSDVQVHNPWTLDIVHDPDTAAAEAEPEAVDLALDSLLSAQLVENI